MRFYLLLLGLVACGDDSTIAPPDAPVDSVPVDSIPVPAGNFTCVGQPPRATAPDPLMVAGAVSSSGGTPLNGATVEVYRATDDVLLGSGTSGGVGGMGRYGISVASGGTAPTVYRKSVSAGTVDTYLVDAFPLFASISGPSIVHYTAAEVSAYYTQAGVTEDASKTQMDVVVLDCPDANGGTRPVAGAKVTVAGTARTIYLDAQGQPDAMRTETATNGYVSLFNVPAGPVDITVVAGPHTYRAALVKARAGAYTIAYLSP